MTQYARPNSDVTVGGWTTGAASLYIAIDEVTPNDGSASERIRTGTAPLNDACEVGTSDVTDPVSSSNHVISVWAYKTGGTATTSLKYEIIQGTTIIGGATQADLATSSGTEYTYTLSGAETDAITDYTDLRIRLTGNRTSGDTTTRAVVYQAEFRVPDVAAANVYSVGVIAL